MKSSEGNLAAWETTAAVLAVVDQDELELLPDIALAAMEKPPTIGAAPGAFDVNFDAVQGTAVAIFTVVAMGLKAAAPKLFDAAIEVSKDVLKKAIDRGVTPKAAAKAISPSDAQRIHELVRVAALERRLSPGTAEAIANAVVARLATL